MGIIDSRSMQTGGGEWQRLLKQWAYSQDTAWQSRHPVLSAIQSAPRKAKIRASLYSMICKSGITISHGHKALMRSMRNLLNAPPPVISNLALPSGKGWAVMMRNISLLGYLTVAIKLQGTHCLRTGAQYLFHVIGIAVTFRITDIRPMA